MVNGYYLVDVDIRLKIKDAFFNLFSSESYNISRFKSNEFEKRLIWLINETKYDAIVFESLFTSPYIQVVRHLFHGPIILRSHNVEFNIWKNLSKNELNPLKKYYLKILAKRLKKYELKAISKFDLVASISKTDILEFEKNNITIPMIHLPFGIDMKKYDFQINENYKVKIYHIGSMNWIPHQEAFRWFFDSVNNELNVIKDQLEIHLAGTGMPKWMVSKSNENTFILEGFQDGFHFSADKDIMIVPSFSGSGIRIKIIEAMALGKTILTTNNGAMGIDCTHGLNIFISDDPKEWGSIINNLVTNSTKRLEVGRQARTFCEANHDYINNAKLLSNEIEKRIK
jgi:glycosyltransferase involved in cell wall biosynthesis